MLPNLSYVINGVLFEVHRELGSIHLEKHYQRGVALELRKSGLSFHEQVPVDIGTSAGRVGKYFLDFVVENLVILELKTVRVVERNHFGQLLAYLHQLNLPLGLLVNFRVTSLNPIRVVNSRFLRVDLSDIDAGYFSLIRANSKFSSNKFATQFE
ncbi:MAG: GxxExxY protein [Candidatus Cloacimonetes bacterium]|nr:GxxExxY protein [Candidatus Cloacimonadota bacterium]